MGIALPGEVSLLRRQSDRQVWNIMGDGAFNMCYPDVITNVSNTIFQLSTLSSQMVICLHQGQKYELYNKHLFGCDFPMLICENHEAQGCRKFTVDRIEHRCSRCREAVKLNKKVKTVVMSTHALSTPSTSSRVLELDPKNSNSRRRSHQSLQGENTAEELVPFSSSWKKGLQSRAINNSLAENQVSTVWFPHALIFVTSRWSNPVFYGR